MAISVTASVGRVGPGSGTLVFYEDNLVDGRAPIEMMQSDALEAELARLREQ